MLRFFTASRRLSVPASSLVVVAAPGKRGDPGTVLRSVVRRAAAAARRGRITRFAVTGGETAAALARTLGVRRWRIVGEVARGVPLASSAGPGPRSWWVTKPGSFGREDVWTKAISLLRKIRSAPVKTRARRRRRCLPKVRR